MAGPFDPIQQPDIPTQRLQQTETNASAVATDALVKGAVTAVAGVQQYRMERKKENLEGQIDAVVEGLRVFREGDESNVKELEDAAKAGNATARLKLEEYRAVQRAVAQGRLPSDAAALRLRAITKSAINEAPEFEEEFRTAARQALGFSPQAEVARRVLRGPTGGKTKAQLEQEEFVALTQRIGRVYGVTQEEAQRLAVGRLRTELEAQNAKDVMQLGDLSDRTVAQHANASASALMQDSITFVTEQVSANGGIFDINAAQTALTAQVTAARAKALAGVSDPQTASRINQNFDTVHQSMRQFLDLVSKQEQADSYLKTMAKLQAAGFAMEHPEVQAWMALPQAETLFKVLEISAKANQNPAIAKALGYGAKAQGATASAQRFQDFPVAFRQAMLNLFQGKPPADELEARARAYGSKELLKDKTIDEATSQELLSDLINTTGEYTAVTALDDPKILVKVGKSPALKAQVGNLLGSKLEGMTAKVQTMKDRVPGYEVVAVGDTLEVRGLPPVVSARPVVTSPVGRVMEPIVELRDTVAQYNRVLEVNNKYAQIGAATAGSVQDVFADITEQTVNAATAESGGTTITRHLRYNPDTGTLEEVK